MAEVLITLGIIGVVAALTLPTLIAKFQNQVYVNRLKKVVSTLENGIKRAAYDEGTEIKYSKFYELVNLYIAVDSETKKEKMEYFRKYFNGVDSIGSYQYKQNNYTGSLPNDIMAFADGSTLVFRNAGIYLDVNGPAKPNEYGRDIFGIFFDQNGIIQDENNCDPLGRTDEVIFDLINCGKCKNILENNPNSSSCKFYRIRSEGWQMNY